MTERLTIPEARRREVIKAMILRYRMERYLDPLSDDALYDEVRAYDEHFTYSRIPTERLKEVYLEAMAHHGQYALVISDFIAAWARIKERELSGHEQAARAKKPARPNCSACNGTGTIKRAVPKPGVSMLIDCDEVEAECAFCVPVVTNLVVRGADFRQGGKSRTAMSVELEKMFSPDVLAAFDERARRIAEQVATSRDVGAVKVETAMTLLDMSEYRVRQLIRVGRLKVINPTPHTIRIPLSEIRRFTEEES